MAVIAVYNLKGGVGKTTIAVNLAWCAAKSSARSTLLWDLDPQGAATYLLRGDKEPIDEAQAVFTKEITASKVIRRSAIDGIDLLGADESLRDLDHVLFALGKKRRLAKLIAGLEKTYDRIVLDCPPGLGDTSQQVLRAASVVIVPVIPSPLSERAFQEVQLFLDRQRGKHPPLLPVHSMVDRRRILHRKAIERHPDWPIIPMASTMERMSELRAPVGEFEPSGSSMRAIRKLWVGIEARLAKMKA